MRQKEPNTKTERLVVPGTLRGWALMTAWVIMTLTPSLISAQQTIDLTGMWDRSETDTLHFDGYAVLPNDGTADTTAGEGDSDGRPTWFRRGIYVPREWEKQGVWLTVERAEAETTVFVNGQAAGRYPASWLPRHFDLTGRIVAGQRNTITIATTGRIVGQMTLKTRPQRLYMHDMRLTPRADKNDVVVDVMFDGDRNPAYSNAQLEVLVQQEGQPEAQLYSGHFDIDGRKLQAVMPVALGNLSAERWDEFSPRLYRMGIGTDDDYDEATLGFCDISRRGDSLFVNGRRLWLRGVEGDSLARRTAVTEEAWHALLLSYKDLGLNYMRFSEVCPPEGAFSAADRLGFYLHLTDRVLSREPAVAAVWRHHPSLMVADSVHLDVVSSKEEVERSLCDTTRTGFMVRDLDACVARVGRDRWRACCRPLTVVAQLPRQVYTTVDTLVAPVTIYNALYGDVSPVRKNYYVAHGDRVVAGGALSADGIPAGKYTGAGMVVVPLTDMPCPARLTLTVVLGRDIRNSWDFDVVPAQADDGADGQ